MHEEERENEVEIRNSEIKPINLSLHEVCKSICKISNKNRFGTGFLIQLYKNEKKLLCLMTNIHVITKQMLELQEIIEVKYKYEKKWIQIKLDKNRRFIKYYSNLDIIIIEILANDRIKEKYFLLPNTKWENFINNDIFIPQYPEGKELSYSEGKIQNINGYELIYDASTKTGSSGSPIFLKNSTEVIGIHKQGNIKKRNENYGTIINLLANIYNNENDEDYLGEFENGKKNGKGNEYYKNGNIKYEGEFVNDEYEGIGKYYFENGEYYSGQWKNGKMNGKGILYYKIGSIKYDGDFVEGKKEGSGKYVYENG